MSEIKIDHDVPIPELTRSGRLGLRKYPFKDLSVGDSFSIKNTKSNSVYQCMYRATRETGFKFKSKKNGGFVRVWRIE